MSSNSNNNKIYGILGTIAFHALLILLFFVIVFKTPIPPFPDTGSPGMEVNFGTSDDGMGDVQPDNYTGENNDLAENSSEPENSTPDEESIMTQETEEAPEVAKVEPKEAKKPIVKEPEPKKEETKKEPERTANPNALYKGKNKSTGGSSGEGETNKSGDQGKLYGSKDSKNHGDGTGTGNTPGNGGNGSGGNGISFNLSGRKKVQLPVPKSSFQEEGKVVVEITVDREGKVVNAKAGVKGSTTSDPQLLGIAKKAALDAKFNKDPEAAELQKGQIIYNFILK